MTNLSPLAAEKGIELCSESEGAIPENILTDPHRLRQILMNIVGNAIKFTDSGRVDLKIAVGKIHNTNTSRMLFITVKDSGKGISAEDQTKLFTPFSQATKDTARHFGGTGLGLFLSRKLAQLLGGNVVLLQSEEGKGSTFAISIDIGSESLASGNHFFSPSFFGALKKTDSLELSSQSKLLAGLKILLVEDGPDNQALISHFLRESGASVELAADGEEGVKKALEKDFDVILMDIQLPRLDGCQATQRLRERGYKGPIIALSAFVMLEDRQKSLASGCDDHLSKPIDRQTLIRSVAQYAYH
jgi:CheY-like chemotaxis protein